MFLNNLSHSLRHLFDESRLSYVAAAELCHLSKDTIWNIAYKRSVPTLASFEKLCSGFGKTPNELLINADSEQAMAYRSPMEVSDANSFRSSFSFSVFPICPRCTNTLSREYQLFCDRCGQHLSWNIYENRALAAYL